MGDCTPSEQVDASSALDKLRNDRGVHKLNHRQQRLLERCFGRGLILQTLQTSLDSERRCMVQKLVELMELYKRGVRAVITAEVWNSRNPMRDREVQHIHELFSETEQQLKACIDELRIRSRGFYEAHRDVVNPLMTELVNWQQFLFDDQWYLQGFQPPPQSNSNKSQDYRRRQFQADVSEYLYFEELESRQSELTALMDSITRRLSDNNSELRHARQVARRSRGDDRRAAQAWIEELHAVRNGLKVSLGEYQLDYRETRAELRRLNPRSRRAQIEHRRHRAQRFVEERRRPNYLQRSHSAWVKALQKLAEWYEWLPRQGPGGVNFDKSPFGRLLDPYTRRHYPIFTGGVWDRQRLWELYLLTLERLAEGTGFFVINQLKSIVSELYGPVNRGLNSGVEWTHNAHTYPGHNDFAIDVGRRLTTHRRGQPSEPVEVPILLKVPNEVTLPDRFWGGTYRYRSSSTVPSRTRAITADQNYTGVMSYGMGLARSQAIGRMVERARRSEEEGADGAAQLIEQAGLEIEDAIEDDVLLNSPSRSSSVIPPRPSEFGANPDATRLLFGLGQHGVIGGSEIDPEDSSSKETVAGRSCRTY